MGWHIFHDWSKWERYVKHWSETPIGLLYPAGVRGVPFECSEWRQKRECLTCGYSQDEKV
jgi:hypothetical protein